MLEQPAVDGDEPREDQEHATYGIPAKSFPQDQDPEQNGADGNQEGHQEDVGGAGPGQYPEVDHISGGGADE